MAALLAQADADTRLAGAYLVTISKTLSIPKDCFELMYRLGQKTLEFKNVTVEFFAPYLLKDGMVQVKFI